MELTEILSKIGLNEKEAKVYLALLELGTADVSDIANKAGIKRPTCYLVLDELKNRGLVSQVPAKVNLFTAESPEKLSAEMHKKQELYKRFLPNMLALYNAKKDKPQVQLFEGVEGVKQVYEKIYIAKEVWFFGTPAEALKIDAETLWAFIKRVAKENIKVRDLMGYSQENINYVKEALKAKHYEMRFLPNKIFFPTDSAIFGDSVVFFSFRPQVFAVVITSKETSEAMKILYEMAWQSARPLTEQEKTALD